MVVSLSRRRRSLAIMPFSWAYLPVRMFARAGQQTGVFANVLRNRMPSLASLSRWGVLTSGFPVQPMAWARIWSGNKNRMFGRFVAGSASGAEEQATAPNAAPRPARNSRRVDMVFRV